MLTLAFVASNWRYLAFAWVFTALSTLGSGYFVGLFSGEIRREFLLSHTDIGFIFTVTTLAGGPVLMWIGRKLDDVDLRLFSVLTCAGFAAGSFLTAVSGSVIILASGVFLIRLIGDWLMVHIAITSLARNYGSQRGRAMALAAIGYSAGSAVFPMLAVLIINTVGWRGTWWLIGAGFLVAVIPILLWLLHGQGERHRRFLKPFDWPAAPGAPSIGDRTRLQVLADPNFYLIMPAAMSVPLILSGLFFHQVHLAAVKGWSLSWIASCFIAYGVAKVLTALAVGPMIDRIGAIGILPYYPLPLAIGLMALILSSHPLAAAIYLSGAGATSGVWLLILGALWPELYGTRHLGAIRSMAQGLTLIGVALSTVGVGWLFDIGVAVEQIAAAAVGLIAFAMALAFIASARVGGARQTRRKPEPTIEI